MNPDTAVQTQDVPEKTVRTHLPQWAQFVIRMGVTVLVIWVLLTFVTGISVCHSDSCSPMIKDGDLCLTWKLSAPTAGDMIVYDLNGQTLFGRVVASQGDRVEIRDGFVWVNGYIALQDQLTDSAADKTAMKSVWTVQENSVFLICPNSDGTEDSRANGAIPLSAYRGKVIFLFRHRGI